MMHSISAGNVDTSYSAVTGHPSSEPSCHSPILGIDMFNYFGLKKYVQRFAHEKIILVILTPINFQF